MVVAAVLLTLQSAVALIVSVGSSSTCPARVSHVRMDGTENFRDSTTNNMRPISAPVVAPPSEAPQPRAAQRALQNRKKKRDVFAATSVFADDSFVPAPWISGRAAAPTAGPGGLMLPKGQSRSSPEQRGDAAQRFEERRARTQQQVEDTDMFQWAKDDVGQPDLTSGSDLQPVRVQTTKKQHTKRSQATAGPNASIDARARELAKEAIEAYFADEIDEAELNARKLLARRQAEAELSQRGDSEEQQQAAILKKAYVDSVKQNYMAATAAREAAEGALAAAVRVEQEAKQRVEEAMRA